MVVDAEAPTKNRGFCFVRYREPAQARKAIEELGGVKVLCASIEYAGFIFNIFLAQMNLHFYN
jgi:RNA recognition motif-containing protein